MAPTAFKLLCSLLLSMPLLTGCDSASWSRGQPASPATLLERGQQSLDTALEQYGPSRPDIVHTVRTLHGKLKTGASADMRQALSGAEADFERLEGKLSIGSRAAYGELSGQLRRAHTASEDAATLLASRILMFLASELSVPAPVLEASAAGSAPAQQALAGAAAQSQ